MSHFICCFLFSNDKVEWKKDGAALTSDARLQISSVDGVVHKLIVDDLQVKDAGEYVVKVDGVESKANLTVKGKYYALSGGTAFTTNLNTPFLGKLHFRRLVCLTVAWSPGSQASAVHERYTARKKCNFN